MHGRNRSGWCILPNMSHSMRYAVAVAVVWIGTGLSNVGAAPEASDEF